MPKQNKCRRARTLPAMAGYRDGSGLLVGVVEIAQRTAGAALHLGHDLLRGGAFRPYPGLFPGIKDFRQPVETLGGVDAYIRLPYNGNFPVRIMFNDAHDLCFSGCNGYLPAPGIPDGA